MGGVCRPPELLRASSRVMTYPQCSVMARHAAGTALLGQSGMLPPRLRLSHPPPCKVQAAGVPCVIALCTPIMHSQFPLPLSIPQILVELAELQDQEVGDGTTSVVIVAAELLRRANELVRQKIHPTSIIGGYRLAMREVGGGV